MAHIPKDFLGDLNRLASDKSSHGARRLVSKRNNQQPQHAGSKASLNTATTTAATKVSSKSGFAPALASSRDQLEPVNSVINSEVASTIQQEPSSFSSQSKHSSTHPPPKTAVSVAPENAFLHQNTTKRVAHLTANTNNNATAAADGQQHAFIYQTDNNNNSNDYQDMEEDGFAVQDLAIVVPHNNNIVQEGAANNHPNPSLRPTNRKEVALLKHTMIALLQELGADEDQQYPTEMHAFLSVIQEEQKIYDSVLQEIIRQVTVNMTERGDIVKKKGGTRDKREREG